MNLMQFALLIGRTDLLSTFTTKLDTPTSPY
jgi:hypothetical protein